MNIPDNELLFFLDEPKRIVNEIQLPPMITYSSTLCYEEVDIFTYSIDHLCLYQKRMFCYFNNNK